VDEESSPAPHGWLSESFLPFTGGDFSRVQSIGSCSCRSWASGNGECYAESVSFRERGALTLRA